MNYANVGGEPVDLDNPDQAPPWYDSDAMHDRRMTATVAPRVPFTWAGLIGQRITISTDLAIYRDAEVIDIHAAGAGKGLVEIVYDGPHSPVTGRLIGPPVHALVNLDHVRSIRLPS